MESAELDVAEAHLDAVERSMERLDEGTYGTCTTCGAPLGDVALAADPTAASCAAHAAR